MSKLFLATIAGVVLAAVLASCANQAVASYFEDPARLERERVQTAALQQSAAQALAARQERDRRDAEFWQTVQPWLAVGIIGLILFGVTFTVGTGCLVLVARWNMLQAERGRIRTQPGLPTISVTHGDQAAMLAVTGHWLTEQERARHPQIPQTVTRYVDSRRYVEGKPAPVAVPSSAPAEIATGAPLALPGPVDLVNALQTAPSLDNILLGIGPGGQPLTVPARRLVHVGVAGSTGQGKSVLIRLLMAQLAATGAVDLLLCDPHYARVDPDSGEDWAPIERRLFLPPATSAGDIGHVLHDLAERELKLRLELRHDGVSPGRPRFLVIDELPVITGKVEAASDWLAVLLREGRKVGLFVICGTQDMLVKTLGTGSGVRDCFRTGAYLGGDATTARVLLDVKAKDIPETELGRGVMMLRSAATATPTLARIPYASNEALYKLLPAPAGIDASRPRPVSDFDRQPAPVARPPLVVLPGGGGGMPDTSTDEPNEAENGFSDTTTTTTTAYDPDSERRRRVLELHEQGVSKSSICQVLWGYKDTRVMAIVSRVIGEASDQAQAAND